MHNIRHAVRALLKARGFTVVAVGTLAVGLALCVTVGVFVKAYLVRGLPYPEGHRLFDVRYGPPGVPGPRGMEMLDWNSLADVIEVSIAWDLDSFSLRGAPYPEAVQGTWVTPGYVEGFGVRPALGRGFLPSDFESGRPTVALISHRLWSTRFGRDPSIVGRTFEAYVNDRPNELETFTVIGVLAEGHWHLNAFTEVLAPLRAPAYPYVVRLKNGIEPGIAADRITTLIRAANPALPAEWRAEVVSSHSVYVQQIRSLLIAVATAAALVMLIACANVAVLLTARAADRRREIAVRQALGATSGQIAHAAAAEPLVIGLAATTIGLGLASTTINAVAPVMGHYMGRPVPGGAANLVVDASTVVLTIAIGLLSMVLCSIVPMWLTRRTPVSLALAGGQKGATDGRTQRRARSVLIAVEVAACLTLLVGAGLTIQSAVHMLRVDMGLETENVVVGRFSLRQRSYPDTATRATFYERVFARAGEIAGLQSIAFGSGWPLQGSPTRDMTSGAAATPVRAGLVAVSPDYFTALRIDVRDGRTFRSGDRPGSEPVAVVSQTLAARLWPNQSALGKQLLALPPANSGPASQPLTVTVVGVVDDVRHAHTDNELADAYVPILQYPSPSPFVYLRVSGDVPAVEREFRQLLASIDGEVAFGAPRPLSAILDVQRAASRLLATLLVVFAAFAGCLALVGIYGVIAYTVGQREREIAVRLAIGADGRTITRMFLRQGAVVLFAGLALGIGGALALGRVLQAQLFDVRPADPRVIAWMTAAFALCGLLAIAWPARRAASTDPAAALKNQ